jgi:hypothetical protein
MRDRYDETVEMLNIIRHHGTRLNEETNKDRGEAIAITNDPRFGTNALSEQIDAFRKTVHPGAKFSDENPEDPESNPLVYYPKTGNLVFSGSIPSISGLKFQISLNDTAEAPYVFADGLHLTESVCNTLIKLAGFTKNFINEWSASGDMLRKLSKED